MIKVLSPSKIKTINIDFTYSSNQDEKDVSSFIQGLNIMPLVYISKIFDGEVVSGMTIEPVDIVSVRIYNNKFLPEISIQFYDSLGYVFENFYPLDDDIISIFVNSDSEDIFPIRMDFKIMTFYSDKILSGENAKIKYTINGILDVNDLHFTEFRAYKNTSYEVLKKIADETGLGFSTNVAESNDEMVWINPAITILNFIQDITKKSYIDDNSFIWTFIDFYYNLNYIEVEDEMNLKPKEKQTSNLSILNMDSDEIELTDLYLTNDTALNTTNQYIDKFSLINDSTSVNLLESYNYSLRYYDKTTTTQIRIKIPELKSEDENLYKLDGYDYDKNNSLAKFNWGGTFYGKLDRDNVHENFIIAEKLNSYNLDKSQKIKMVITLSQLNLNIKRFQRVNVILRNIDNPLNDEPQNNINQKLSGYWLVTGINYTFKRISGVSQEIFLTRRDLNKSYKSDIGINKLLEDNKK